MRAFAGELFKTVRRPAVWVCVLVLLGVAVTIGYGIPWLIATYAKLPAGSTGGGDTATALADIKLALYPINVVRYTVQQWSVLGGVFALIVGVLLQGSEFGWGTVKTLYTQRDGRLTMLAGKVGAVALCVLVMVLGLDAVDAVSSIGAALLDGKAIAFPDGVVILKGIGALYLSFAFWAVFGLALATLFRQSAMAIGLGLAYALVIEALIFGLAANFAPDTVNPIRQWFPITNVGYLADSFGAVTTRGGAATAAPYAGATHAVIVLVLYVAAFAALSAVLVRRRDVTS